MTQTGGQTVRRPVTTTGRRTTTAARRLPVPAEPTRAWRWLSLCLKLALVPLFSLAVVAALAYVRLLQGPVALSFLVEPIQNALSTELSGVRLRLEDVSVRLADSYKLQFELKNVRVTGEQDETLALAPAATVSLSRPALLTGRIAAESVALISPRLLLYYGDDGNLSLKFSHPADTSAAEHAPRPSTARAPGSSSAPAGAAREGDQSGIGRIDLVKILSEASGRARRHEAATAYLRELGLKSATVVIDNGTRRSVWRVPELFIDLDHARSRSSIAGRARMDSLSGPWTLNFRTLETTDNNRLQLAISVQGLVPHGLARSVPALSALEGIDLPLWGEAKLDLSNSGEILAGSVVLDAAPGRVALPWLSTQPVKLDGAHVELAYDAAKRHFQIAPSALVWGDSHIQFTGAVTHAPASPDGPAWNYAFRSAGGWLGAEPPLSKRLNIDDWSAQGSLSTERARIVLKQFNLRAGGATITASGDVTGLGASPKGRLEGKLGPMSSTTFQALWPGVLAPRTRTWLAQHLVRGQVQGGAFRLLTGAPEAVSSAERASLTLEASNVAFNLVEGWPLLEAPRALVRLDGQGFELAMPDGSLTAADGRRISAKGSFTVDMGEAAPLTGHINVRSQGPASLAYELLNRPPFRAQPDAAFQADRMEGRVDAQLAIALPLDAAPTEGSVRAEGKVRILDGRMKSAFGNYDITSANVVIDLANTSADARGEMLINGVVGKIAWQHVFGAPPDKQPPLRITSVLDNSYRTQLGLDINDIVQGDVPVEVAVTKDAAGESHVHVRADLLNADLTLDSVAWRKPKGRGAIFEFDYAKGTGPLPVELRNVKLVGDNIALEGWIGVGADNKVREFRFPTFSLNVVTSLEANGRMRSDGIWEVTAKGSTYDGRDLFRSFFDVGQQPDPSQKPRPGLDLKAEIGTVVGHFDTNLRNVRVSLQKRGHKMVGLDARGVLDGNKLFAAVVRNEGGQQRQLLAESQDAGQLFKLVGFYPNAVGGLMILQVNLDGEGVAERTGTLSAHNFVILGDSIISEVLQNADGSSSSQLGKRKVMREQFEFERMRIPFSVGHGQFVMNNGMMHGPLIGTTLRGRVDFRAQQLDVGGTYVPLSGLNRVIGNIPFFGQILAGAQGEGVLGITFAIKGSMSNPEVLVNPFSLVTPGIFREIMQMTPEDPKILPRPRQPVRSGEGPRASSSPAASTFGAPSDTPRTPGEVGGSWSAQTNERKR